MADPSLTSCSGTVSHGSMTKSAQKRYSGIQHTAISFETLGKGQEADSQIIFIGFIDTGEFHSECPQVAKDMYIAIQQLYLV